MAATWWVALGGALGSVGRYWTGVWVAALVGEAFPWGTLLINILGSFVIGCFGELTRADGPYPTGLHPRLFVMAGLCGGYTTFSAFSLQVLALVRTGQSLAALGYIAASLTLSLLAVTLGYLLAGRFG